MNLHKIFKKTMLTLLFCTPLLPASDTSAQDFFTKLNGTVSLTEPKQILSTSTEESNTIQKLDLLNRLPYRTLKHLVKYYNPEDTENNNEISYKFEDRQKTYSSSISQETFDKFIAIAISTNNSTLFKVISEYKVPFNTSDVSDLIQYLSYAKRNGISDLHLRLEPEPTTQEPNYTLFDFAKKRKGIAELELDLKKPNEKKELNLLKILCSVYADLICTLDASDLNIEDEGADAIASETRLTNLKHLDLTFNKIKNTGAQAIISALHLKTIKSLKLTWNQIQSDALISFESANHLENLKSIDLGWNQIQDEGVKAL